ncbi:ATP-dependent DNA ligase [soil metagenome]
MADVPTTVEFPRRLPVVADRDAWRVTADGVEVRLTNLDKPFWPDEGYTKGDVVAYYANVAERILPFLRDRPLTLKRMPNGVDGDFFYAKQAPPHTPAWVRTAPVVSADSGKRIDYLLAQDTASLLWLANLGCVEMHPWHSRVDALGRPDYAFFDLDPFGVDFPVVRAVGRLVHVVLEQLGLRGYPRTSGATGLHVYVPIDRVHTYAQVREWVGRVCRLINRADPDRTTMEFPVARRTGRVFLDHNMNTEGRNIAAVYSLRPEPGAPVATPLRWAELDTDVHPRDFTIRSLWTRLDDDPAPFEPVLAGGQDLRAAMAAVGMSPEQAADDAPAHRVAGRDAEEPGRLGVYTRRRDFARTPEPPTAESPPPAQRPPDAAPRFVLQHHLATRLHHDLRLERGGTARSWAVPKGLPDVPGVRHKAVQTEDHPLEYMTFSGDIPAGEYGGGPVRIWDAGTYEPVEWHDDKVTFRLHGRRHEGEFHLFRVDRSPPADRSRTDWLVVRAGGPQPGLPGPPARFAPMLAVDAGGGPFDDPEWLFEVKWDGVRAIATTVRPGAGPPGSSTLVSRRGNDVTGSYPELSALWERVLARNAVLDGEIVAFTAEGRPSFQALQRRMHLRDETATRAATRAPVSYLVFDLLAVDGETLVDVPLRERLSRLDDVLVPGGPFQRSEAIAGHGVGLYRAVRERGMEGVIAKRARSTYQPGRRSRDWRKLKVRRDLDCVVGGWLPGEGGRSATFASLLLGLYGPDGRLRLVGQVGTGFDDAELRRVHGMLRERETPERPFAEPVPQRGARWVRPTLVVRVAYAEVTDAGRLRAPSYAGLRPDAEPRACVTDDLPVAPTASPPSTEA